MNYYIIITIIVFVVVVILMISWSITVKQPKNFPLSSQFTQAGFGMRCTDNPPSLVTTDPSQYIPQRCSDGLKCVYFNPEDTYGICRKSEGSSCNNVFECEPDMKMCFGNICSKTSSGGLNQSPPCLGNLIDTNGICKKPEGESCSDSSQCSLNSCVTPDPDFPTIKICKLGKTNGLPCVYNPDCISEYCDLSLGYGICQPLNTQTGDLGAVCFYYKAPNQSTRCRESYNCSLDLATNTNNLGFCANSLYTWPSNTLNIECNSDSSCLPPSVCNNGICVFPNDPLSCTFGNTSGLCTLGYNCQNDYRCIPTLNFPGITNKWVLFQWIRSTNSKMGFWSYIVPLDAPGILPTLSTLNSSIGLISLYNPDTSIIGNNYTLTVGIQNSIANFIYVKPGDWNANDNFTVTPSIVKFISNKVALLIKFFYNNINTFHIIFSDIPTSNVLNFLLPTKAVVIGITANNSPIAVNNFDLDLRGTFGRLLYIPSSSNGLILYNNTNLSTSLPTYSLTNTNFVPLSKSGTNAQFLTLLGGANDTSYFGVQQTNKSIYLSPSGETFGNGVSFTAFSSNVSTPLDTEILYSLENSTRLQYKFGLNNVTMPIDANVNSILSIGVLDTSVIGTDVEEGLYILTTSI